MGHYPVTGLWERRRITAWAIAVIAAGILVPIGLGHLRGVDLELPGSSSARAAALIAQDMPQLGSEQLVLTFTSDSVPARDPLYQRAMSVTAREVARVPGAGELLALPRDPKQDRHHAYLLVGAEGDRAERQRNVPEMANAARRALAASSDGRISVALTGLTPVYDALVAADLHDLRYVEIASVLSALVLLVFGLGSVGSALLPVASAGAGALVSAGVVAGLSLAVPLDTMMLATATTVGFGLGLDYNLLVMLRYRRGRAQGLTPDAAAGQAKATSGRSVLWCAGVVIATSAALLTVPVVMIRNLALAAGLTTAVTAAAAVTLLPSLLIRFDRLLSWGQVRRRKPKNTKRAHGGRWAEWARLMMRHPWPFLLGALAVLCLAAAPVGNLKLGLQVDRSAIAHTEAGRGLAQMERDGLANLTVLTLPHTPKAGPVDTGALIAAATADPDISHASALDNGRDLTVMAIGDRLAVDSADSAELMQRLRILATENLPPGQRVDIGGPAAALGDFQSAMVASAGRVALLVLAGSFLLMLVMFRSLLLPLKAIAMNVLSTAAAFGLLVQVSDHPVNFAIPLLAIAIAFGLSLDYEVFLVHRISEHYRVTGDCRESVTRGLIETAQPITLGAAAMATVFAGLMATHRQDFQQLGFLVAASVLMDATLIRLVLVPCLMQVLGHRNWWLPRLMHRLLRPVVPGGSSPSPLLPPSSTPDAAISL